MEWIKELVEKAEQDEYYQICLEEVRQKESGFQQLRDLLPEPQRQILDSYLSACDELDHAMVRLAYQLGREEK